LEFDSADQSVQPIDVVAQATMTSRFPTSSRVAVKIGQQTTDAQQPVELPNLTRPNLTKPYDIQPDPTKPGGCPSVVGREVKLNWDWTFEDLDREAQLFRKVSQLSQSALPSKVLGRLAGFGLAVGVEFLHDLALTMRNAKEPIKRPQKYIDASMRKSCEERGIDREALMAGVSRSIYSPAASDLIKSRASIRFDGKSDSYTPQA
jgi:hypothetical protein